MSNTNGNGRWANGQVVDDDPYEWRGNDKSAVARLWPILHPYRKRIILLAAIVTIATFVVAKFFMDEYYRAEATLRAASQEVTSQAMMGSILNATSGMGSMLAQSLVGNVLGMSAVIPVDVAEQEAILNGYNFTVGVVKDNHLESDLLPPPTDFVSRAISGTLYYLGLSKPVTYYDYYKKMTDRFDCKYDEKEGNLTIGFIDKDPVVAAKVLEQYIERMRERLRRESVEQSSRAVEALRRAVTQETDPMIATQVSLLLAQEIQQKETTEAQVNFAFTVVESPWVPSKPYSPHPSLDAVIAGGLTGLLACFYLIWVAPVIQEAREAVAEESEPSAQIIGDNHVDSSHTDPS